MTRTSNNDPVASRPVPMRTCVGCRSVKPKRELVRLVRTCQGYVEIDTTGKKDGRGVYICPDITCWDKALKGQQLERTLKSALTPENRAELIISGRELMQGVD